MKQIIIVRKDLNMSKGKMSAKVAHASMAFLINLLKNNIETKEVLDCEIGIARTERIVPFTFTQKKEIMIHHYKRSDLEKWAEETKPTSSPISETLFSGSASSSLACRQRTWLWYASGVNPVFFRNARSR